LKAPLIASKHKLAAAVNINLLEEDVSFYLLSYLTPYEMMQLMQSSKATEKLCKTPHLWTRRIVDSLNTIEVASKLNEVQLARYKAFFILHRLLILQISLKFDGVCVVIHGNVYNVTNFIDLHPGGRDVLLEFKGKDATREFTLANHSWNALNLAKFLVVASYVEIYGKQGVPAFVLKYLKTSKLEIQLT
jgi:hypothetical protein